MMKGVYGLSSSDSLSLSVNLSINNTLIFFNHLNALNMHLLLEPIRTS